MDVQRLKFYRSEKQADNIQRTDNDIQLTLVKFLVSENEISFDKAWLSPVNWENLLQNLSALFLVVSLVGMN